jgi:hypothetical protein
MICLFIIILFIKIVKLFDEENYDFSGLVSPTYYYLQGSNFHASFNFRKVFFIEFFI